ncbi:MAG: succinylglutamate desuccinylase/aspartoacylase family protein [Pseudobdellovibrionaceae bacterium]|jgi:predicted deacylase|nr:succinylglutamate desuccinylase/aspartoacylase family protein [Pseudobdellovibrionaceae bacterium]
MGVYPIEVFRFQGKAEGPTLLLFGAIHGNEVAGPRVLLPLVEKLSGGGLVLDCGQLIVVPICNQRAHDENKRYVDVNLNRLFGGPRRDGYEAALVGQLEELIGECDYLLDIHSTHSAGDPAFSFADRSKPRSMEFAKALGVDTIILDWEQVYPGEDFSTEAYANRMGKVGITLEAGYHNDPEAIGVAERAMWQALRFLGMISGIEEVQSRPRYLKFTDRVMFEDGDRFTKSWVHMESVAKGEGIYTRGNGEVVAAERDGVILIPFEQAQAGDDFYYFGVQEAA